MSRIEREFVWLTLSSARWCKMTVSGGVKTPIRGRRSRGSSHPTLPAEE